MGHAVRTQGTHLGRVGGWMILATLTGLLWPCGASAQETVPDPERTTGATFVAAPPVIDGVLDESMWSAIEPITEFRQRDPVDGGVPTERTEVRIAYDADHLYFGFILHDSDPDAIRRSILHREGRIDQDDHVWIVLDTYHDGRNAYIFELNPFGTQGDALFTDESMSIEDWNWEGVYESEAHITDAGWALEVAIPFTTIRFSEAEAPTMGIAIRRAIRRKNEQVFWPHIPQRFRGGITQVSQFATLTGLQGLSRGRHMEVKPFVIGGLQNRSAAPETDVLRDVGVDFKYGVTSNLTLDLTWNTDFAQVEADNVEINLTRFNLFFPEKREFFLERAGLFTFGNARDTEIFFSRRIGLTNEILGGGRLTGQLGKVSMGVLSLQTEDASPDGIATPGANHSVLRVRADVLPRSTLGGIFTNVQDGAGHNRVTGIDTQLRFWGSSSVDAWVASVWDSELTRSTAGSAALNLRPQPSWSAAADFMSVDEDFQPGLGFVRRLDMVKWGGNVAWTPRFESSAWARSLVVSLGGDRTDGQDGSRQSASQLLHNMLSFQAGGFVSLNVRRRFERLEEPSAIQGRTLSPGDYTFTAVDGSVRTDQSRTLSGNASLLRGDFWNGSRTQYGGGLMWKTGPYLTLTGSATRNDIELPVADGTFSTTVLGLDVLGALSRSLFANALVQWDDVSQTLQASIRINWIHTPGSDLFLVLNSGYLTGDALDPRDSRWLNRTGVVKVTFLRAF
ncbi:MAG: DUF5916 domain-containing protein [Gemmatimonadota bacterium]